MDGSEIHFHSLEVSIKKKSPAARFFHIETLFLMFLERCKCFVFFKLERNKTKNIKLAISPYSLYDPDIRSSKNSVRTVVNHC